MRLQPTEPDSMHRVRGTRRARGQHGALPIRMARGTSRHMYAMPSVTTRSAPTRTTAALTANFFEKTMKKQRKTNLRYQLNSTPTLFLYCWDRIRNRKKPQPQTDNAPPNPRYAYTTKAPAPPLTRNAPNTRDNPPSEPESPTTGAMVPWFWIELFCGFASFTRYAITQPSGWNGACIIVDFRTPHELGITDLVALPNVFFICMDLSHMTYEDINIWSLSLLGRAITELYAIHASHPCDTLSLASACMGELHRGPNSAPISWMAQHHDSMLQNLLSILESVHKLRG